MTAHGATFAYVPAWAKRVLEGDGAPLHVLTYNKSSLDSLFNKKDCTEWAMEGCVLSLLVESLTERPAHDTATTEQPFYVDYAPRAVSCYHAEYVSVLAATKFDKVLFTKTASSIRIPMCIEAIASTIDGYVAGVHTVYYDVYHIADNVYGVTPYLVVNTDKVSSPLALNNKAITCFMRRVVEILYGHTPKLATVSKTPAFNAWVKGLCSESRYEAS